MLGVHLCGCMWGYGLLGSQNLSYSRDSSSLEFLSGFWLSYYVKLLVSAFMEGTLPFKHTIFLFMLVFVWFVLDKIFILFHTHMYVYVYVFYCFKDFIHPRGQRQV